MIPILSITIEPRTRLDQQKLAFALSELAQEDSTLKVRTGPNSSHIIISGMSEYHIESVINHIKGECRVELNIGTPQVIYRETILRKAEAEGRYIRQTGGAHNYAHVIIRISPNEYGQGYEFSNDTKDGSVPTEYVPSIDQGIQDTMLHGILAGYEMVDIKASLYNGSYQEIESNEMSFKIAASMAFKEAARKARPVLLEPVMEVKVSVPEHYMGTVIADLNSRRGRIEDVQMLAGTQVIKAAIPLGAILGYAAHIRSVANGRASCFIRFRKYEVAPS